MICLRPFLSILFLIAFVPLSAQVTDDFTDGDFTNNPTWTGDIGEWEVLANELHLNNMAPASANTSHLSTPSIAIDNANWEFYVRTDFNTSGSNYVDVFLVSDLADLEGAVNGYFVRIGGSSDEVSLFETTAGSASNIINGRNGILVGAPVEVRVRVTRDALGNFELFSDTSAALNNFISEGTATDLTHTTSNHFGVLSQYTSTRNDWCYIDNILVTGTAQVDTTPPALVSAAASSATELLLEFSEDLDVTSATNTANYLLNGATNPVTAVIDPADSSLVRLGFASNFPVCVTQDITVNNVDDRNNNTLISATAQFNYAPTSAASFKGVIINEIFADPTPQIGLPTSEFVELYNRGTVPVDLMDWTFSDGGTPASISNSSYLLCPGEYVILCSDTAAYNAFGPAIEMSLPALNNGGDPLGLRDNNGVLIDSVTYDSDWYGGPPASDGGVTLELINPTDTCSLGGSNWAASTDAIGGTPGSANSVQNTSPDLTAPTLLSVTIVNATTVQVCFDESLDPGVAAVAANYSADNGLGNPSTASVTGSDLDCVDLVFATPFDTGTVYTLTTANISDCKGNANPSQSGQFLIPGPTSFRAVIINEIFPDPDTSATALPNGEYVELYNRSNTVVDLAGWTFSDASSDITLPAFVLQPGEYVAITPNANAPALGNFGGAVLGVSSLPSLNNSGDELGLRDSQGSLVDSVEYLDDWYQDDTKDGGGYSLELINPDDTCSYLGNWIASNDPNGGTPGAQNSVFNNTPDIAPPNLLTAIIQSGTAIEICFDETMDAGLLADVSNYSVDNGLGQPSSAVPQGPANACVVLNFATPFDTGTVYTISFTNIADCKGNSVGLLSTTFVQGGTAAPFQIVINEIMADPTPAVGLPEADYVELFNNGPTVVELAGFVVDDPSSTDATLPNYTLFPGEYVLVCDDSDSADFRALGYTNIAATSSFPSLNSTGDSLRLYDGGGNLIDFVFYDNDWYQDESKEDGGWSLERIDPTFPCNNAENWRASDAPAGGSPGLVNTILGTFSDTEAPLLERVEVIGPQVIRIYFNELMDAGSLVPTLSYVIDNGIGSPVGAVPLDEYPFGAELILGNPLDTNIVYCITVSDVTDCAGNSIDPTNSLCFGIPAAIEVGDLIINEILFNPYTGGSDFVELYNTSDKIIDLSQVSIGEIFEGTDSIFNADVVSSSQVLLLPQSYVALTADQAFQESTYQPIATANIYEMSSFPTYDDNEGECVIFTDSATVLDRFAYLDDWHFPNLDDDEGVSLERQDFDRPTQDENNWHSAASTVLFATPGYKNSQVLVPNPSPNQVSVEPETFSPDQDGFEDVLSINYQFSTSGWNFRINVFDNKGRLVRELVQNTLLSTEGGTFTWDGTNDNGNKVDVGIYVLLVEAVNPNTGDVEKFKLGCVVAGRF